MKQLGSEITSVVSQARKASNETGPPHGETGCEKHTMTNANLPVPSQMDGTTLLMKSLTRLEIAHQPRPVRKGKNVTVRKQVLAVSREEALNSLSTLSSMLAPVNDKKNLAKMLAPLREKPSQAATDEAALKVYVVLLLGQPKWCITRALGHTLRSKERFRPTAGEFLDVVDKEAKAIELKLKHLQQALEIMPDEWSHTDQPH